MPRLRPALALLAVAAVLPISACSDGRAEVKDAATEGVYATAADLKYQVQMSRKLNVYDVEDREYFTGLKDAADQVTRINQWYGVFIRVENRTDHDDKPRTIQSASRFLIQDNTGKQVKAVSLPADNLYAYKSTPILPGKHTPEPSSTAATASIGGNLILFKVPQEMLDNRPTKLVILPVDGSEQATITLDI